MDRCVKGTGIIIGHRRAFIWKDNGKMDVWVPGARACASVRGFRVALTTRQMDPANNPAKISEFRHIIAAGQY